MNLPRVLFFNQNHPSTIFYIYFPHFLFIWREKLKIEVLTNLCMSVNMLKKLEKRRVFKNVNSRTTTKHCIWRYPFVLNKGLFSFRKMPVRILRIFYCTFNKFPL